MYTSTDFPNSFDPCFNSASWDCHGFGSAYEDWTWATAPTSGVSPDDGFNCPSGCTTFELGDNAKMQIRNELNNFIRPDAICQQVKNLLNAKLTGGKIRLFLPSQDPVNWGDYHFGQGDIHIATDNFSSAHRLGVTLMHEGWHAFWNSGDDTAAAGFAQYCVTN